MKTFPLTDSQAFSKIDGIAEFIILDYFTRLNNGQFIATANLFSEQGWLTPPFEKPIQGRAAIAHYLQQEASGMKFYPEQGELLTDDGPHIHYQIRGKVETNWFTVNIAWSIQLNVAKEIVAVEVDLLASLNELLSMNRR